MSDVLTLLLILVLLVVLGVNIPPSFLHVVLVVIAVVLVLNILQKLK